ncbi:EpsG family protein [Clostridium tarantellae]|uniref:EpsG family protein n=1 Tax=Clostridium tarantellae TaxID=39493 RepID=A0A6I1MFY8_9CLOT|nr:EpsG family protein [Clostridium tarantellae]
MDVLFYTLIATYIIALIARLTNTKSGKASIFFTFVLSAVLILVAGLRHGIGDTVFYVHTYEMLGPGFNAQGYEPGFLALMKFLKSISTNPQVMVFTLALITTSLNIWTLRNYSKKNYFELVIFMYIASGYYLVTMNALRQALAAAIIFSATPLILKGKMKTYMAAIAFATLFHNSSVIMIPVYFIARTEAWSKTIGKLLAVTLVAVALFNPIMDIVFGSLSNSKYGAYATNNEGGANLIRIALFAVPVLFAFIKRESLKEKWPDSNIFVNISLVCFIIMMFSAFNWAFARFTVTLQPYSFILLPYIIKNCLERSEKRLVYLGFLIGYLIFFYFEHGVSLGIVYRTKFTIEQLFYYVVN